MFPLAIVVRERGATPRNMRKIHTRASKLAFLDTGTQFHLEHVPRRFTEKHAREAGFGHRKGELLPRGTKAFRQSYTGRKLRAKGHTNPLEYSGDTKRALRWAPSMSATSKGVKIRFSGARTFNYRHPKSRIRMSDEFRRITKGEAIELGNFYDRRLDVRYAAVAAQQPETVRKL